MSRKNKLENLRDHLFETIELLKDGDIEIGKAQAINNVGKTLVDLAKVELNAMKLTTTKQTDFFAQKQETLQLNGVDELEDCKCGDAIYPSDLDRSREMGLDYARCSGCLDVQGINGRQIDG